MIKEAEYIKGLTNLIDQPELLPQILLLGRSNVGKSSFINSLTNRKNLARISVKPGKTIVLNYYLINRAFYLVDAPGYGYAKRSKDTRDDFVHMIEAYLLNATHLKAVVLLIDFKVGPTTSDLETYVFLKSLNKSIVVVGTKKDKVPKTHQYRQEKIIRGLFDDQVDMTFVSNVTKENIDLVRQKILTLVMGESK
ncbi:MAG: ribosome biogenesis GTP-binding protein YihA/YsxC [Acholeplasmataceae bacterium]